MTLNSISKKTIKAIFNEYGIFPSKGLGQNFLIDKFAIKKVIKAAELTKKDTILEIGPGIGNLTQELAQKAGKVIAVEKDPKMIEILKETLKSLDNAEIITEDILKIPNTKHRIQNTKYKIVANLPFYLTAPVIRKFLESEFPPKEMVLIIQKEVAQRICQKPPRMNLLAVSVQFYAKPEIVNYISKKSFWPEPKVDSAIIKIVPKKTSTKPGNIDTFFKVVKAGFSQPRKMLINNLSNKLKVDKEKVKEILQKNHISPLQRPETLRIGDWENLAQEFSTFTPLEKKF